MSAREHDVIVVGGGVAGLVAASTLASSGRRVLLLEARGKLGGRASSFVDRVSGDTVDNGPHILMGCYQETLRWLERVGSRQDLVANDRLEVPMIDERGGRVVLSCPNLPAPFHLVAGVLRWSAVPLRDRLAVLRLAPLVHGLRRAATMADAWTLAKPGETVAEWLDRYRQPHSLRRLLWEPLTVAALNQSAECASAGAFLAVLKGVAAGEPADARILLSAKPLQALFGEATAAFLERSGSRVRLHAPTRVTCPDGLGSLADGVVRVTVRGERLAAGSVVIAVPWFHLDATLEGGTEAVTRLRKRIGALRWSPIVSINLWYDRSVLDETFVGLPGRMVQWAFRYPSRAGGERVALVVSDAVAAMRASDADLVQQATREMADALPRAAAATVRHAVVIREPRATFAVPPDAPSRPATTAIAPGIFLAGDWVDTGWPSTIESAARSGRLAAEAVLAS